MKKENINETKQFTKIYDFSKRDMEGSNKLKIFIIIIIVISLLVGGYFLYKNYIKDKLKESIVEKEENKDKIINLTIKKISGTGVILNKNTYTIKENGIYTITGTTNNGNIVINDNLDVNIILDNASIQSNNTAAIICENCDNLIITLKNNTVNYVKDGINNDYHATIYSKNKFKINGEGILNITGNVTDGIKTDNGDISIENGTINITAKNSGLNSLKNIIINGGNIYINAEGNGIKSSNDLTINGGSTFIMSSLESNSTPINSEGLYRITGGTLVALGNGILNVPSNKSTQKTILFYLDNKILNKTLVALLNEDKEEIIVFKGEKTFKNIAISTKDLRNRKYSLYTGGNYETKKDYGIFTDGTYEIGTIVTINNSDVFEINDITNIFGSSN